MFRCTLSLLLIFTCFALFGQSRTQLTNPNKFKTELIKLSKETKSIITEFKQEKQLSFLKDPQLSEGMFYYEQKDKMRWEQNAPFNYTLLINGTTVRISENGKEKKIAGANKMMGRINALMIGMINGDIYNSNEFSIKYFTENDLYIVELTPKNKRLKSIFQTIELAFLKTTVRLKTLTFNDNSGDKTKMTFFNECFNQTIDKALFLNL